jgi:alpha-N-acetylglucosamine transferase
MNDEQKYNTLPAVLHVTANAFGTDSDTRMTATPNIVNRLKQQTHTKNKKKTICFKTTITVAMFAHNNLGLWTRNKTNKTVIVPYNDENNVVVRSEGGGGRRMC